ncbi:hypothetical protein Skr01_11050 [Sphaerisporangium krabiense]|nr:hypothetical protein Skr01_11050 [Sphaerisporangium krabiense]
MKALGRRRDAAVLEQRVEHPQQVQVREIAEGIGRTLGLPVVSVAPGNAVGHFGFVGRFFGMDMSASSARTRDLLSWTPAGPTLIEDIEAGAYAEA